MSMIQSAVLMTSRLCSITTTVVALLDQFVQHFQKLPHILEVQAGGRFVEDVERAAGGAAWQSSFDSFTRCASPPESVVACWPTLM